MTDNRITEPDAYHVIFTSTDGSLPPRELEANEDQFDLKLSEQEKSWAESAPSPQYYIYASFPNGSQPIAKGLITP